VTTTYAVTVTRVDGFWAIEVPGTRFGHTQARKLGEVEFMARDLLAAIHDVPADSFELSIKWPVDMAAYAEAVESARTKARKAQKAAEDVTLKAVRDLKRQGLSVRDTAAVLHLSPARVGQIVKEIAA